MKNIEIKNEIYEIKKWEEKMKRKDLKYKTNKYTYDFQQFETIRSFGDNICTCKIDIDESEMDQSNLLENIVELDKNSRPRSKEDKEKKRYFLKCICSLWKSRLTLNDFKSGILPIKAT